MLVAPTVPRGLGCAVPVSSTSAFAGGVRGEEGAELRAAGAAVGAGLQHRADGLDARYLAPPDRGDDGVDADVEAGADDGALVPLRGAGAAGEEQGGRAGLEGDDEMRAGDLDRLAAGEERYGEAAVLDQGDARGAAGAVLDQDSLGVGGGEEGAGERRPVVGERRVGELAAPAALPSGICPSAASGVSVQTASE